MLIKPLLGVASDAIGGYVETRKAKAEQKLTAIKAETEIKKKQIAGEIDWDVEAIKGSKDSWKDEYLTILFSIPLLLCFLPFTVEYVERGFAALAMTPDWYKYTLGVIVSASFGIRGAKLLVGFCFAFCLKFTKKTYTPIQLARVVIFSRYFQKQNRRTRLN